MTYPLERLKTVLRMPLSFRRATVVVGLCVLQGCGTPDSAPSSVVVSDSAGVRLVVDSRPRSALAVTELPSSPAFRVGWDPSGLNLERVAHGMYLRDGRIVVVDAGGPTLYLLGPGGELESIVAQVGAGPGELQSAGRPVPTSDTAFVITDAFNQRVSRFVGAQFQDSEFLEPMANDALYEVVRVLGPSDYIFAPATLVESALFGTTREWKAFPVIRGSGVAEGQALRSFDLVLTYTSDDWNPVRPTAAVRAGPNGLVHTKSSVPEARWYDWAGDLQQIARWSSGTRDLTDGDWSRYEDSAVSRAGANSDSPRFRANLQKREEAFAGPTPEFGQVLVSEAGDLYLGTL